jgi:hypothetical protein
MINVNNSAKYIHLEVNQKDEANPGGSDIPIRTMLYAIYSRDNMSTICQHLYTNETYSHAVERHNQPKAAKEGAKHGFVRT